MANIGDYDATGAPQMEIRDPIPAGWYPMAIAASDMKATKSGKGSLLEVEWRVLEGQYKGRKVWCRLNLNNPSQQAVEIAYRELSSICHAVGQLKISDSVQLHDKPCMVKVKIRPADGQYEPANDITGYKSMETAVAEAAAQPAQGEAAAQPVGAAAGGSKPPWEK